jgi:hypothetical protein
MNTYTFTYYGWIPGYNDFDQEWFDVVAASPEEALKIAQQHIKFVKYGPSLVAVNGHSLEDHLAQLAILN